MPTRKVLIAGASGLVGYAAAKHFASLPDWEVVGVSRRKPADIPAATLLSVDLLDSAACQQAFGTMTGVTHLVYAALQEQPGLWAGWLDPENMERNAAMLRNLFEPLAQASPGLEHVSLLHGTKAYGVHHPSIGPKGAKIPLREREPRREHPNFYFLQEDYLREKQQRGATWGLTVLRPTVIYGEATGNNMNPIPAIAAYAAILREAGEPLYFPGREGQPALHEAVDADLIARALAWAATSQNARNETFNLTNGDVFLWENVWPAIAEALHMRPGEQRPYSLAAELPKHDAEWAAVVQKYHLPVPPTIVEYAGMNSLIYADSILGPRLGPPELPLLNSTIKARQAGFHDCIETEDMFRNLFGRVLSTRS